MGLKSVENKHEIPEEWKRTFLAMREMNECVWKLKRMANDLKPTTITRIEAARMTTDEAKDILKDSGQYAYMTVREREVALDGVFNLKELAALIFLLDEGETFKSHDEF